MDRTTRDPVFDPLRAAPVPDSFESQMARLRARPPRRTPAPTRALAVVAALAVAVGACALPVDAERPLGYAVRWTVAGAADESHPSARALAAAVPPADRLLSTVEADGADTRFRTVVAGPPPELGAVRAAPGVSGVESEPLVEPVRVPLGAWVAERLGAGSVTVGLGSPRLTDAEVGQLLSDQLVAAGIDTAALAVTVGRDDDGRRSLGLRVRTMRGGVSDLAVPVGPETRVRVWGGRVVVLDGLPPGSRPLPDSAAPDGAARIVVRDRDALRGLTPFGLDSLLRASGHGDLADTLRQRARTSR